MYRINQVTDSPKQAQTLTLPDGTSITFQIEYKPQQLGWFITTLAYKNRTIHNIRICTSPNLIRQFKNQIPFGIMCTTTANQEPTQQSDFTDNGRSKMYILTHQEVTEYEAYLGGT